jgi:hypothetical protein
VTAAIVRTSNTGVLYFPSIRIPSLSRTLLKFTDR